MGTARAKGEIVYLTGITADDDVAKKPPSRDHARACVPSIDHVIGGMPPDELKGGSKDISLWIARCPVPERSMQSATRARRSLILHHPLFPKSQTGAARSAQRPSRRSPDAVRACRSDRRPLCLPVCLSVGKARRARPRRPSPSTSTSPVAAGRVIMCACKVKSL